MPIFKKKVFGSARINAVFAVFEKQIEELKKGVGEVAEEIATNVEELTRRKVAFEKFEQKTNETNAVLETSETQASSLITNLSNLISAAKANPIPEVEVSGPVVEEETEDKDAPAPEDKA